MTIVDPGIPLRASYAFIFADAARATGRHANVDDAIVVDYLVDAIWNVEIQTRGEGFNDRRYQLPALERLMRDGTCDAPLGMRESTYAGMAEQLLHLLGWRPWWERERLKRRDGESLQEMERRALEVITQLFHEATRALQVYAQAELLSTTSHEERPAGKYKPIGKSGTAVRKGPHRRLRKGTESLGQVPPREGAWKSPRFAPRMITPEPERRIDEQDGVGYRTREALLSQDEGEFVTAVRDGLERMEESRRRLAFFSRPWRRIARAPEGYLQLVRLAAAEFHQQPLEYFFVADQVDRLSRYAN